MPDDNNPIVVRVNQVIRVEWSNGAGYSLYKIEDHLDIEIHHLEPQGHFEYAGDDIVPLSCPTGNCD